VTSAGEQTWTITLQPESHKGMRFQPGQFAWFSLDRRPFGHREHPFSFCSGTGELPEVSFTIRERGDFTSRIGLLEPGTVAFLDGPYGHFSYYRHPAPGYVFIAGGIGITPVMSMLRSLAHEGDTRPLRLIYVCRSLERYVFREELQELSQRLRLKIILVFRSPPPGWHGETGRLTPEMLERLLPRKIRDYHYFVCGPDEMMDMVERELYEMDVRFGQVHSERFNLV
jgi:predicted ferric reductase